MLKMSKHLSILFVAMAHPAEGLPVTALRMLNVENSLMNIPRSAKARPYVKLEVRNAAVSVIVIAV